MVGKHSCGDSRITCIDCGGIICSKCLVECPVGFRCKSCGTTKNPLTDVSPWLVAKILGICTAIGCGAGWLLPFINVPFLSCIIAYFLGLFIGRWLTKFIDYKLGRNIGTTIVFGILIGMSLSPYVFLPMVMVEALQKAITEMSANYTILDALTDIVGGLFTPVCFLVGILRPTVWGERF